MQTIEQLEEQLEEIKSTISDLESQKDNFLDNHDLYNEYDQMLDECYQDEVDQVTFISLGSASELIKEHDPVMYRCGYNDFIDNYDLYSIDEYIELSEEIEKLEEQLTEIEEEIEQLEEEEEGQ